MRFPLIRRADEDIEGPQRTAKGARVGLRAGRAG
ncbi:hypothetical protein B0I33_11199 [Prauserella shujinwangii]|uniref:Uncharacterized protein n=1 Tax=Prauserella shujinwangii TaxID=1453103 RepID=A0A2T0LN17_9PSEU|nr:hypothetical protein B0I33_11199 [Prauserella shujinwangii]